MSANTLILTDDEFTAQVLQASQPVLVDFWAEWCGPCRTLGPIVDDIATTYEGRLQVGKLNIDDHPNTPSKYAVQAIPTLLLFKNGEVVERAVGLLTKVKLEELLKKHI